MEINDDARGTYNTNNEIIFKTTMLKSSFYDYSDSYILVKRTTTVAGQWADAAAIAAGRSDKQVIFKNCASFTDCFC